MVFGNRLLARGYCRYSRCCGTGCCREHRLGVKMFAIRLFKRRANSVTLFENRILEREMNGL